MNCPFSSAEVPGAARRQTDAIANPGEANRRLSLLRLMSPENHADPHVLYRELREFDPVHWDPYMHAWVITSYAEAIKILQECSAARIPAPAYLDQLGLSCMKPFAELMQQQLMFMDGAMHTRLRSICSAAFTTNRVQGLRKTIEKTVNELIDKVATKGNIEMVGDLANPLPAILTAKLLGVPVEDHAQLHAWVLDLAEVFGNFQHHPDRVSVITRSLNDLKEYISEQMQRQRNGAADGLIGSLMTVTVDGQKLSDEEVLANTIITLIGGHETTTNLISGGFLTLMRHPESFEQFRENPGIAASAVEELLRFESPVQHTARIASSDFELLGKSIRKGSRLVVVLAAANRDPSRFPEPDRLNLMRPDNRHLAFGWASHFCFGAPLARLEGQIAFTILLRRLVRPSLVESQVEFRENAGLRGMTRLHVAFEAC